MMYAEYRDDGTDMQLLRFKDIKVWDEEKKFYAKGMVRTDYGSN